MGGGLGAVAPVTVYRFVEVTPVVAIDIWVTVWLAVVVTVWPVVVPVSVVTIVDVDGTVVVPRV